MRGVAKQFVRRQWVYRLLSFAVMRGVAKQLVRRRSSDFG